MSTLVADAVIPFTLVSGRKYAIEIYLRGWDNWFKITDTVTTETFTLPLISNATTFNDEITQSDSYKLYLKSGTTTGVKVHNVEVISDSKPLLHVSGDSILAGSINSKADFGFLYATQLIKKLRGNVLISARGGASIYDVMMTTTNELQFIKPIYAMLSIGTNGGFTSGELTGVVTQIQSYGIIPIINYIPCCSGDTEGYAGYSNANMIARNAIIEDVCASTGALLGCRFDIATAIGGVPANGQNTSLFHTDKIHPNATGQNEMFKRFAIDCPYLFN